MQHYIFSLLIAASGMAQRVDSSESVQLQKPNWVNHISAFSGGWIRFSNSEESFICLQLLYILLGKQTEPEYEIWTEGEITPPSPPPQKTSKSLKVLFVVNTHKALGHLLLSRLVAAQWSSFIWVVRERWPFVIDNSKKTSHSAKVR